MSISAAISHLKRKVLTLTKDVEARREMKITTNQFKPGITKADLTPEELVGMQREGVINIFSEHPDTYQQRTEEYHRTCAERERKREELTAS